jgi:hypothetical protein
VKQGSDLKSGKVDPHSYSGGRVTRQQTKDHMKYSSIKVAGGEFVKQQKTSFSPQKEDGLSNNHTDNDRNLKVRNALFLAISILLYMYCCFLAFKSCLRIIGLRLSFFVAPIYNFTFACSFCYKVVGR